MRRAAILLTFMASPASAATRYGWLLETDNPSGFAVDSSIYERTDLGAFHERRAALLLVPKVALTESLALALPLELASWTADDTAPGSGIARYGAELRWRFLPRSSPIGALARVMLARDVTIQSRVCSELELAASYDVGRLQVELDTALVVDVNFAHVHRELRPGAGASVRVASGLRVGAEIHAELSGDETTPSWAIIGPNLAWARGGFWLAGALGVGIHNITAAPRLNVGMAW